MTTTRSFRGFRFPAEVILWAVRWHLWFPVGHRDRDLKRMLADRGVSVDHTTMYRWVRRFAPELERRIRRHLRPCRGPWHVDETLVRVGGGWRYPCRAADGTGQAVDLLLAAERDKRAAEHFLSRALVRENTRDPREIVTDRLTSYPGAIRETKREGGLGRLAQAPPRAVAQRPGRAGPPPHQGPGPAHTRLQELPDGSAHAGRGGGGGDAGQGTSACRAGGRHAGAADARPPSLRPRHMGA
jgi:transposase-like protein